MHVSTHPAFSAQTPGAPGLPTRHPRTTSSKHFAQFASPVMHALTCDPVFALPMHAPAAALHVVVTGPSHEVSKRHSPLFSPGSSVSLFDFPFFFDEPLLLVSPVSSVGASSVAGASAAVVWQAARILTNKKGASLEKCMISRRSHAPAASRTFSIDRRCGGNAPPIEYSALHAKYLLGRGSSLCTGEWMRIAFGARSEERGR